MSKINRFISVEIVLAILFVVVYFLPWYDWGILNYSGWGISGVQEKLVRWSNFFSRNKSFVYTHYIIYLIPIFSVLTIALWLWGKKNLARLVLILNSVFGILLFLYLLVNLSGKTGIGVYFLCAISVITLFYLFYIRKKIRQK